MTDRYLHQLPRHVRQALDTLSDATASGDEYRAVEALEVLRDHLESSMRETMKLIQEFKCSAQQSYKKPDDTSH